MTRMIANEFESFILWVNYLEGAVIDFVFVLANFMDQHKCLLWVFTFDVSTDSVLVNADGPDMEVVNANIALAYCSYVSDKLLRVH